VTLRTDVQFRSGFPDDAVWDDDDGRTVWPGRNVTEALKVALERLDYRVSEPICLEHAGWELDIWRERKSFCLRVSVLDADECYLMSRNSSAWLWPDMKPFRKVLSDLKRILDEDGRFDVVGWFPRGGSASSMKPTDAPFSP
jgi:hypothetical protein